ncbi:hypothetical protein SESBI_15939 [Sesbania bispinosa]|nr:hypothetical protein SESBI_15939 [Sesbania bispinosa]
MADSTRSKTTNSQGEKIDDLVQKLTQFQFAMTAKLDDVASRVSALETPILSHQGILVSK